MLAKKQFERFILYLGYSIGTQGLYSSSFFFENTATVGQEACKRVQLLIIPATHLELQQSLRCWDLNQQPFNHSSRANASHGVVQDAN